MNKSCLDTKDAAKYLSLGESTLNDWRTKNQGPKYIKFGTRVVYRIKDLDEYADSHVIDVVSHDYENIKKLRNKIISLESDLRNQRETLRINEVERKYWKAILKGFVDEAKSSTKDGETDYIINWLESVIGKVDRTLSDDDLETVRGLLYTHADELGVEARV